MQLEVEMAADFIKCLLGSVFIGIGASETQLEVFKHILAKLLSRQYEKHWFTETPSRGSAFRCLRIQGKIMPPILDAAKMVGMPNACLSAPFPIELSVWIDPNEVSYRFADNGPIYMVYDKKNSVFPRRDCLMPILNKMTKLSKTFYGFNNITSRSDDHYAVLANQSEGGEGVKPNLSCVIQPTVTARNMPEHVVPYMELNKMFFGYCLDEIYLWNSTGSNQWKEFPPPPPKLYFPETNYMMPENITVGCRNVICSSFNNNQYTPVPLPHDIPTA